MKLSASHRVSPSRLAELLDYDPGTGRLTWKERPVEDFKGKTDSIRNRIWKSWNAKHFGKPALACGEDYPGGTILGMNARAHQVAWAITHGVWASGEIDHINGDPSDNRIANLRDVPKSINSRNKPSKQPSRSGRTGVIWDAERRKWAARIKIDRQHYNLGRFDNLSDAVAAREEAEIGHGFTKRHASPDWTAQGVMLTMPGGA